jgi:hypothetical protein
MGSIVNFDTDVTIQSDPGATIYYTTAVPPAVPADPTSSSAVFSGSIPVHGNGTSLAIKALAVKSGMKPSTISSASYTVAYLPAAAPSFSFSGTAAAANVYVSATTITLSTASPGANVYYTTDGSTPTTASTPATAPISIAAPFGGTRTIRAIAQGGGFVQSPESAVTYSLPLIATDLAPSGSTTWFTVSSDATGTHRLAGSYGGTLAVSSDDGTTWTTPAVSTNWQASAMSVDGSYMFAANRNGAIYRSADSGATWSDSGSGGGGGGWYGLATTTSGNIVFASGNGPSVYQGTLYGTVWTPLSAVAGGLAIGASSDGTYLLTSDSGHSSLNVSSTAGVTWTNPGVAQSGTWTGTAVSGDGTFMAAVAYNGDIWTSTDHGASWNQAGLGTRPWNAVAISSDGSRLVAAGTGFLTLGTRSGTIWTWTDLPYAPAMGSPPTFQAVAGDQTLTNATVGVNGGSVWNLLLP